MGFGKIVKVVLTPQLNPFPSTIVLDNSQGALALIYSHPTPSASWKVPAKFAT